MTAHSPAAVPDARTDVEVGPRGFAALHRDTWRTALRLPLVAIIFPLLVWLPFDLLGELIANATSDDPLSQLRAYNRVNNLTSFFVGALVNGVVLVSVFAFGRGEKLSFGEAFSEAGRMYSRVLHTSWSFGWRVGLATLLLIVPGIVLAVRYAFALPITVLEGAAGPDAIDESVRRTEGHRGRIFGYATAAIFIYMVIAMAPAMLVPETGAPVLAALSTAPFNLISTMLTIAGALLYLEATGDTTMSRPVGRVTKADVLHAAPEKSSGVVGVVVATAAAVVLFIGAVGWLFLSEPEPGYTFEADSGEVAGEDLQQLLNQLEAEGVAVEQLEADVGDVQ
jgi:hypothetical protein